jgi:hypothetical protein
VKRQEEVSYLFFLGNCNSPDKMQESVKISDTISSYLDQHELTGMKLAQNEKTFTFGQDIFLFITEFVSNLDLVHMGQVSKSWQGHIHLVKNFVCNQICIILDNTGSMDATAQNIQKTFLLTFLRDLHRRARVAIRLVKTYPELNDLRLEGDPCTLIHEISSLLNESFYCAGSTPLFQSICNAVTEGFKILLCLTDGMENECSSLSELKLFQKSFGEWLGSNEKKALEEDDLTEFMQSLLRIVPTHQVFLPAIVGLNMQPSSSKGLLPVFTIQNGDSIPKITHQIRKAVIPVEAGGGLHSIRSVLLQDRNYQNTDISVRHILKNGWLFFPPAKTLHCITLLTAHRHFQFKKWKSDPTSPLSYLLERIVTNGQSWKSILEQEIKDQGHRGWYFRFAKSARALAQHELEESRCMTLNIFQDLIAETKTLEILKQEVIDCNWTRYISCRKKKPRKRKSDRTPAPLPELLKKEDFRKIIGPSSPDVLQLIKKIPRSCYPISLPIYFWLVRENENNALILHDLCLLRLRK